MYSSFYGAIKKAAFMPKHSGKKNLNRNINTRVFQTVKFLQQNMNILMSEVAAIIQSESLNCHTSLKTQHSLQVEKNRC